MRYWIDGSGKGVCCYVSESGSSRIKEVEGTSNEAEYHALLLLIQHLPTGEHEIYSDSKLLVEQVNHRWHIKEDRLRKLAMQVWASLPPDAKLYWCSRKENQAGKLLG